MANAISIAELTTLATTFSLSAINTSMNADGDVFKQAKDISTRATKDTFSPASLRSAAIAGAVAGLSAGAINLLGGSPNLESGSYKDSKVVKRCQVRTSDIKPKLKFNN